MFLCREERTEEEGRVTENERSHRNKALKEMDETAG